MKAIKKINQLISKLTLTTNYANNIFFVFAVSFITISLLLVIFNLDDNRISFGSF